MEIINWLKDLFGNFGSFFGFADKAKQTVTDIFADNKEAKKITTTNFEQTFGKDFLAKYPKTAEMFEKYGSKLSATNKEIADFKTSIQNEKDENKQMAMMENFFGATENGEKKDIITVAIEKKKVEWEKSLETNYGVNFNELTKTGESKRAVFERIWKKHASDIVDYNDQKWRELTKEQVSVNAIDLAVINGS